jgi:Uma2 family endonuclease
MSALTAPHYMTIAEFDALPDRDDIQYELHEGELVEASFPVLIHGELQDRLRTFLAVLLGHVGIVRIELPFQILRAALQTKRRADVGFFTFDRAAEAFKNGILEGAPNLIIEVLSASNTAVKLNREARLYLANGAQEFWEVDYDSKTIRVRRADRHDRVYELDETIALSIGGGHLKVADVFEGIPLVSFSGPSEIAQ